MGPSRLGLIVLVVVGAAALAWWPWRGRRSPLALVGFAARWLALALLGLLLIDPGISTRVGSPTPLVLLDNSISMHAPGGQADSAARLAQSLGTVRNFGELSSGVPGAPTLLAGALKAATATGRRVRVVTDGEVSDADRIPADILAAADITVLPRTPPSDVSIASVRMPSRLAAGDTLNAEVAVRVTPGWADSVAIVVRSGERTLLRGIVAFDSGATESVLRLGGALPVDLGGTRWIEVARVGPADAESGDDVRWRLLDIAPTPAIVVVRQHPDWDGRFFYTTMRELSGAQVRGYVRLADNRWFRMDDLSPVNRTAVIAAANSADLVVVRGDTTGWSRRGRARLLWPGGNEPGDWYAEPGAASPLSGAMAAVEFDSLPPLSMATPESPGRLPAGWTGMVVRKSRRGAAIPIIRGSGRTVVWSADGFHRWAFRGGRAAGAWRSLVAQTTSWLLAAPDSAAVAVQPVEQVGERGKPLRFRFTGSGNGRAVAVTFTGADTTLTDTLRFGEDGLATVALPVGRYRYSTAEGAATGVVGVEPWSSELFPGSRTLQTSRATIAPTPGRRSLRGMLLLFAVAAIALAVEWLIRRILGLG